MSDPRRVYVGWLLDPAERTALLARFPPRYPDVVAHHVTQKFGDARARRPPPVAAEIVGEADDGRGVQTLVVRIDGSTDRPDGSTYHITWSLAPGREARESNAGIRDHGWRAVPEPVAISITPKGPDD